MDKSRLLIVHDVLGTLFSLDEPIQELKAARPELSDKEAYLIIFDWYHAVQRDFTTRSSHGQYLPIGDVFRGTLPRILMQAGVAPDSGDAGADGSANAYPDLTASVMGALQRLTPRPGMQEAFTRTYRDAARVPARIASVDLVGATNGSRALTHGNFRAALGDAYNAGELAPGGPTGKGHGVGVFSCDDIKIAKPLPQVYAAIKKAFGAPEHGDEHNKIQGLWFVASHTWDLYAARHAGFHTAWVSYEEHYACPDVYGRPDVVGRDMKEVAERILEFEAKLS